MSKLRGEVWSKVLTGVRYTASGATTDEMFAKEDIKALAIADDIIAMIREALLSRRSEIEGAIFDQMPDSDRDEDEATDRFAAYLYGNAAINVIDAALNGGE